MSEENLKLRRDVPVFVEHVNNVGEYVKDRAWKTERWGFYLRFCGLWFFPCKADQEKLKNIVLGAYHITIGNKDYAEPIELSMTFDIEDDVEWETVERRRATEEEKNKLERWE